MLFLVPKTNSNRIKGGPSAERLTWRSRLKSGGCESLWGSCLWGCYRSGCRRAGWREGKGRGKRRRRRGLNSRPTARASASWSLTTSGRSCIWHGRHSDICTVILFQVPVINMHYYTLGHSIPIFQIDRLVVVQSILALLRSTKLQLDCLKETFCTGQILHVGQCTLCSRVLECQQNGCQNNTRLQSCWLRHCYYCCQQLLLYQLLKADFQSFHAAKTWFSSRPPGHTCTASHLISFAVKPRLAEYSRNINFTIVLESSTFYDTWSLVPSFQPYGSMVA